MHFRRALPVKPEVFPTKVENVTPFDIYHNVMASPLTLRDLDYRNDRGQTLPPRLLLYQSIGRYIYMTDREYDGITNRYYCYITYDITIYKGGSCPRDPAGIYNRNHQTIQAKLIITQLKYFEIQNSVSGSIRMSSLLKKHRS